MKYIIYFIILSISLYIYYRYAQKKNILDTPNERSSHSTPTIRGGGIIFFIAGLLYFLWQFKITYPYFLAGFVLLSIIGFIDDKKELSVKIRFPFQLLAVILILSDAGLFTSNLPVYIQIIGFIIGVGFINAFNFMDGINGITGLYTLATTLSLLYLNQQHPVFDNDFFIIIIIAVFVFGFFNFRKKALMFAGDVGSMALAALILFWITKMMIELQSPILLLFVLLYGLDSALTIIYRIYLKEDISLGHRHHIYQKMVDQLKWSHLKVAFIFAFIQILISYFVIKYIEMPVLNQISILLITILTGSGFYVLLQRYFIYK